jgi:hypothetical protein
LESGQFGMPPAAVIPAGLEHRKANRIRAAGPPQVNLRLAVSVGQDGKLPGRAANGWHGIRARVRRGTEVAKDKYAGSSAEHLWRRLDSVDFINRGTWA